MAVEAQKGHGGHESRAFVAVDEGVGLRETEGIGCGQRVQVGHAILEAVQRSREARFEETAVTQARSTAMAGNLTVMNGDDSRERHPSGRHANA